MMEPPLTWTTIEKLLEVLIQQQQKRALNCGRKIVPHLTEEDMLQPNDFPDLDSNPNFRYEEGVIEGLRTALMALRAERAAILFSENPLRSVDLYPQTPKELD